MNQKFKIAIIEDDIAIVQMYRMKFEAEGYEVATAANGEQGLELIQQFQPNVVLLDLMMPVMDGLEMLVKMRQQSWGQKLPIIILTNMGESEAPQKIHELGVKNFIVKAEMTPKQVAEKVKELLSQSS